MWLMGLIALSREREAKNRTLVVVSQMTVVMFLGRGKAHYYSDCKLLFGYSQPKGFKCA